LIKPDHLSAVITATTADFLVVIGDRNMKNDTVQGRRGGRLVEVPTTERLSSLLQAWITAHGGPAPVAAPAGRGAAPPPLLAPDANDDAHFVLLSKVSGIAHPRDRFSRMAADAGALTEARRAGRRFADISLGSLTGADQALVRCPVVPYAPPPLPPPRSQPHRRCPCRLHK